ncbi:hypothetical protein AC1031_014517 [Aphanomyces cochlioides]|nr:hypothetical protein AC1031_014517 [Aphanomyces cochlioides]
MKLLVCHLRDQVRKIDMFFRLKDHIITRVQLVGWITSVQPKTDRVEYVLDDGTGEISLVKWNETLRRVALGDLVRIQGKLKLSAWLGQIEIIASNVTPIEDPNEEILHWVEVWHLFTTVYSKPCLHAPPTIDLEEQPVESLFKSVFLGTPPDAIPVSTSHEDYLACAVALYLQCVQGSIYLSVRIDISSGAEPKSLFRFQFQEIVNSSDPTLQVPPGINKISAFRRAFTSLRKAGLCYLEVHFLGK